MAIDKQTLLSKYRAERDKRLRPDGNAQYIRLKDRFAHYAEDPYVPVKPRTPKTDHVTFAFVGGGFAGLVTGARVAEAGIEDASGMAAVALHTHVAATDDEARERAARAFDLYVETRLYARKQVYDDIIASGLSLFGSAR